MTVDGVDFPIQEPWPFVKERNKPVEAPPGLSESNARRIFDKVLPQVQIEFTNCVDADDSAEEKAEAGHEDAY